MSVYIDSTDHLVHDQAHSLVLTCPHCDVTAHISVSAVPRFADLQAHRPKQIGVVYRCDACCAPIFLRFETRSYGPARIELQPQFIEVERPREKFAFTHLPEDVEVLFREALVCFSSGAFNAFGSMCRRTAQSVFADLGEAGKLRLFDALNDLRELVELDPGLLLKIKTLLFDTDTESRPHPPLLDSLESSILLEVMKDLLHEAYVRKGRLQQVILFRRRFADDSPNRLALPVR